MRTEGERSAFDAMREEWKKAWVYAADLGDEGCGLIAENVTALTINFPAGSKRDKIQQAVVTRQNLPDQSVTLFLDNDRIQVPRPATDQRFVPLPCAPIPGKLFYCTIFAGK